MFFHIKNMTLFILLMTSTSLLAQPVLGRTAEEVRKEREANLPASCPEAHRQYPSPLKNVGHYLHFFLQNQATFVNGQVETKYMAAAARDLKKFPESLNQEMLENNAKIHLIYGQSVSEDPSWDHPGATTLDGRDWASIPGTGGHPPEGIPTRVVVNRLYEGHSANVILHELAHTLDSLYERKGISNSADWQFIFTLTESRKLIQAVCNDVCNDNSEEAFAEMFAYYHNCENTRWYLEKKAPTMASYFKNLKRIREKLR